jgi:triosephosphate isomerase
MGKKLIAGNWKMNLNTHQASMLLHKLDQQITAHRDVEVVVFPNMLVLQSLSLQVNHRKMKLGAQNAYWRDDGAFTGEISATMLRGLVDYVIVGHSERRHIFGERDTDIRQKVQAILRNGMKPILCVGETANERTDGETKHVLHDQVVGGLANVTSDEIENITIAYEPVWAIGTGNFAKPADVVEAVKVIRHQVLSLYGKEAAANLRILYGGSVDDHNAAEYLTIAGIDGLLVGGSSLKANVFSNIVMKAHQISEKAVGAKQ